MVKDCQIYFAPIQGVTNFNYRNVYNKHFNGIDRFYAPYILVKSCSSIKNGKFRDILPLNNAVPNLIPQIMSNDADDFIVLAEHLYNMGYEEVNWNMGCPFPMVARKKRGSGLLPEYELVDSILDKVCAKVANKVSVKVRLGRENSEDILKLIPIFNRYPLEEIIVHPRTGVQMYEGVVDLNALEKCMPLSKHEIVYNGDIFTKEDFLRVKERFPSINKWMLARGALANPFLPMMIKDEDTLSFAEKVEALKGFHDELFNSYILLLSGPRHVCDKMKEIWSYLSAFFADGDAFFKKVRRVKSVEEYVTVVTLYLEEKKNEECEALESMSR